MHSVIFGDQILAQLHDYQFMEMSQCNENLKQDFLNMYPQRLLLIV